MMIRYLALVAVFLFAASALANGAERHRHSRAGAHSGVGGQWHTKSIHTYVTVCRCGVHLCGTTWTEGGVLHRCRRLK